MSSPFDFLNELDSKKTGRLCRSWQQESSSLKPEEFICLGQPNTLASLIMILSPDVF
jgi:hypothetical protein